MSKTIEIQVEKTNTLVAGLRKNIDKVSPKGVNPASLDKMESLSNQLLAASREIDSIREDLGAKVKAMNAIVSELKDVFIENKNIVKRNFEQPEWINFGVQDKR